MTWRIGLATGSCADAPILEVLDAAEAGGFEGVELGTPPKHFAPWAPSEVEAVARRLQRTGASAVSAHALRAEAAVAVRARARATSAAPARHEPVFCEPMLCEPVSMHAPFGGLLDLAHHDDGYRRQAIEVVLTSARALQRLGGRVLVVHPTDHVRGHQGSVAPRIAAAVEALRTLTLAVRDLGLTLAIETPLPHLIGGHPDEFAAILDQVGPAARVCLDTGHTQLAGYTRRFVELAGDRLVHVHAHDNHGRFDDHLVPGDGVIDWPSVAAALRRVRFRGWIVLELKCPDRPRDIFFRRARLQAERLLNDAR